MKEQGQTMPQAINMLQLPTSAYGAVRLPLRQAAGRRLC